MRGVFLINIFPTTTFQPFLVGCLPIPPSHLRQLASSSADLTSPSRIILASSLISLSLQLPSKTTESCQKCRRENTFLLSGQLVLLTYGTQSFVSS